MSGKRAGNEKEKNKALHEGSGGWRISNRIQGSGSQYEEWNDATKHRMLCSLDGNRSGDPGRFEARTT
jgi:hypothetical protein